MKVLRTPDERFASIPDWPYEPRYADVSGDETGGVELRAHYIDEGPAGAAPVLLMHGEPTWAYLYRKVIPVLLEAGHRVVAPDLIGLGRSDKPSEPGDYSYARHVEWMRRLLFEHLDLHDITFFGQDWGGLIGLRLVALDPERYARVCVANTGLPTGDRPLTDAFLAWQKFSKESPNFEIGRIVSGGCADGLSDDAIAAYDAPFPDESFKASARIFPSLVPTGTDDPAHRDNVAAWEVLSRFDKPFLTAFSDKDAVTAGGFRVFQKQVAGAQDQPHVTIEGGGHFLQEDRGEEVGRLLVDFIARTS
ncbi:MAG TPA: haloalkane dehalogenase [Acidimicrobiales bacterium]|nr:haloalkane dehalogenase [Acidimicrobiales bacterium]